MLIAQMELDARRWWHERQIKARMLNCAPELIDEVKDEAIRKQALIERELENAR